MYNNNTLGRDYEFGRWHVGLRGIPRGKRGGRYVEAVLTYKSLNNNKTKICPLIYEQSLTNTDSESATAL